MTAPARVAAWLDAGGELGDLAEPGLLCLLERRPDGWARRQELAVALDLAGGLAAARASLRAALARLEPCPVFAVRSLRGAWGAFLEEAGFRVWSDRGPLAAALDQVIRRDEEAQAEAAAPPAPLPAPHPLGRPEDGAFAFDLVAYRAGGDALPSRDVLLPFLETVPLRRLELRCDHLPRWFAAELPDLGLVAEDPPARPGAPRTVVVRPAAGGTSRPPGRRARPWGCGCGG